MEYILSLFSSALIVFLVLSIGFVIFLAIYIVSNIAKDYKSSKVFNYEITIPRGNSVSTHYTNEYEIRDNIIYFNNMCATHFIVRQLKEEAN